MQIKVFKNFSKKVDSTMQPTGGTTVDVQLKDNCSIEAPVFILSGVDPTINYIQAFGRYYHVEDYTVLDGHRSQLTCACDLLATAKSDILAGDAFIERSSVLYDENIIDRYVSSKTRLTCDKISGTGTDNFHGLYYVITVSNNQYTSNPLGMANTYILTGNEIQALGDFITDPGSDITNWAMITFGNVFESIISCKCVPFTYDWAVTGLTQETDIHLGKWSTHVSGYEIGTGSVVKPYTQTFTIPSDRISNFRKVEPYSTFKLFIPHYGILNLPGSCMTDTLYVDYSMDLATGEVFAKVRTTNTEENIIASIQYNAGIDIPLSQLRSLTSNAITGLIGGATSILGATTGNPLLAASGAVGIMSGLADQGVSVKGGTGGRSMFREYATNLYINYVETTDEETNTLRLVQGKPYMEANNIGQCAGGYVKTIGASIATALSRAETAQINAALDGGIYLE